MSHDDPDLTADERRALELLRAPSPPPDFAARVMARHAASGGSSSAPARSRSSRALHLALGAAGTLVALAAATAALWLTSTPAPSSGALVASDTRHSLSLAHRGVAVAEPGAALSWSVDGRGAAAIEQTAGNVFYRVEPGGAFVVSTSAGEVRVTGTCFRVEVSSMKPSTHALLGGAVGAAIAAVVTVTVYEGQVVAAAAGEPPRTLVAGERAQLAPPSERALSGSGASAVRAPASPPTASAARAVASPLPAGLSAEQLYAEHARVAREADTLRARLGELEAQVAKAQRSQRTYGLEPEELRALADRCELRWDNVPLSDTDPGLDPKVAEQLSLSEEEREAVSALMRKSRAELADTVRTLYTELTGDTQVGSLNAEAMIHEIIDKTSPDDRQLVFQRLARERAGLSPAHQALPGAAPPSPYERLFRSLTASGDALEAEVSKELGPDTARRIRDQNNGWGDKHRSSQGCPDGAH